MKSKKQGKGGDGKKIARRGGDKTGDENGSRKREQVQQAGLFSTFYLGGVEGRGMQKVEDETSLEGSRGKSM
eukprot:495961-Hanusia_phi.AAC.4